MFPDSRVVTGSEWHLINAEKWTWMNSETGRIKRNLHKELRKLTRILDIYQLTGSHRRILNKHSEC